MSYRLIELPGVRPHLRLPLGGWGSQITRFALKEFLRSHLEAPVKAREDLYGSGQARAE